jgi:hypothetical protein
MERRSVREASLGTTWGGPRDGIRGTSQHRPLPPEPQPSDQSEFLPPHGGSVLFHPNVLPPVLARQRHPS